MFVRSAFRVSDEEIRLTVLKEFLNLWVSNTHTVIYKPV
jgi:hypothetical protein